MTTLWIDFETRSHCDLKAHGVYNYAMDPTTEVLCMCYAFDDEEVRTLVRPTRVDVAEILVCADQFRAHNAAFERLIITHALGIDHPLEKYYCTAAQARANCMPGSLEDAGRFSGASMRKDHRGAELIRKLCIPKADGTFSEDPKLMQELFDYCAQDVRAMREISKSTRQLSDEELADYHINERINDRGIRVDVKLAQAAVKYAAQELRFCWWVGDGSSFQLRSSGTQFYAQMRG